jgi:6-phosphogluconolactonase
MLKGEIVMRDHIFSGFIGTYTKGDSKGIYSFELNTENGRIENIRLAAELENPTYVTISEDKTRLYSVVKEGTQGGAAAFSISDGSGLTELNRQLSDGASPCHISVNKDSSLAVTANYHKGTIEAYGLTGDGSLLSASSVAQHEGTGPNADRQEKPHAHYAGFTPDENYIAAVDLGTDEIITYELNEGQLKEAAKLDVKPGSGPRHLVFHPERNIAYVMTELSSEVLVLEYSPNDGSFKEIQTVPAIPETFRENNQGSAIHISSDGRFVYAANRGHDSIAVYSVNEETGRLEFIEHTSTEGNWPRDFVLDPSEKYIVASNQETGGLTLFARDAQSGRLSLLQKDVSVPYPVCVKFL